MHSKLPSNRRELYIEVTSCCIVKYQKMLDDIKILSIFKYRPFRMTCSGAPGLVSGSGIFFGIFRGTDYAITQPNHVFY